MLCSKIISERKKDNKRIEKFYISSLEFFLKKDALVVFLIVIIILGIFFFSKKISRELSPREDRGAFFMLMESPEGSTFENTVNQMLKLEKKLMKFNENNEANRILLRVPRSFSGTENFSDGIGIIVLNHWDDRRSIWEIIKEIKKISSDITDSKIIIFPPRGLGQRRSGSQLQFVVSGDTYANINKNMEIILKEIENNKNFLFTRIDYKKNRPQLEIQIDKDKASDLQISNYEIGRTLEILLAGRKINTFIEDGEEYYVILQAKKENRENIEDLGSFEVKTENGNFVRLENILNFKEVTEAKELNRYNKMRSITLSAGLQKGYSLGEAIKYLENISESKLEGDFLINYKGQSKEYKKSSNQFYFLFVVSLLFVYLVLCAQFESFKYPLIIILTVPMTLISPLMALYYLENTLNIFSQIGIIILMGIAAKNGILIVEFAKQLKSEGKKSYDALISSCKKRFRPIIMTGLSTVVGVFPLIIGSGAGYESRLTIGIVLISGIIFSVLLTLYITPYFFKVIDDQKVKNK